MHAGVNVVFFKPDGRMSYVFFSTLYFLQSPVCLFSHWPSPLLLSVRVLILKYYKNLHVHFEDSVGRRVTNASLHGRSAMPSSPLVMYYTQRYLYLSLCLFSCTPCLRLDYRFFLGMLLD